MKNKTIKINFEFVVMKTISGNEEVGNIKELVAGKYLRSLWRVEIQAPGGEKFTSLLALASLKMKR